MKSKKTGGRDLKHKKRFSWLHRGLVSFSGLFCVKNLNSNFQDWNWGLLFKTTKEWKYSCDLNLENNINALPKYFKLLELAVVQKINFCFQTGSFTSITVTPSRVECAQRKQLWMQMIASYIIFKIYSIKQDRLFMQNSCW